MNLYGYCSNQPSNLTDPDGLFTSYAAGSITSSDDDENRASGGIIIGQSHVPGLAAAVEAGDVAFLIEMGANAKMIARANKICKVFVPKHKLDPVVKALGSKGKALDAMKEAFKDAAKGAADGVLTCVVTVGKHAVTARGAVVGGVAKFSNAWIP